MLGLWYCRRFGQDRSHLSTMCHSSPTRHVFSSCFDLSKDSADLYFPFCDALTSLNHLHVGYSPPPEVFVHPGMDTRIRLIKSTREGAPQLHELLFVSDTCVANI